MQKLKRAKEKYLKRPRIYKKDFKQLYPREFNKQIRLKGKYVGPRINNKEHGVGQFLWNDGYAYEGQFDLGFLEGEGIYGFAPGEGQNFKNELFKNNKEIQTYKGDFKKNRFDGKGILI